MYFTPDWEAARRSVEASVAALEPAGGRRPRPAHAGRGDADSALHLLARDFDQLAVPAHSGCVPRPAITGPEGVIAVPPDVPHLVPAALLGVGVGVLAGLALGQLRRSRPEFEPEDA